MRDGFLLIGTLVAASSPILISSLLDLPSGSEGERAKFYWIGLIYAPLVVVACLGCVLFVPEKKEANLPASWNPFREFSTTFSNRPFMILLLSYSISAFGSNLPATLILYYVEYVLQSQKADAFLLLYFVTGIVFLPGWIALSRRVGKKEAWLSSMAINTGAFVGVFFLGPGDETWYGILVLLSGIGLGGVLAIPSAMQADVIDYDESLTGERREGHYIGVWSVVRKLAAALGIGLALFLLGQSGYAPGAQQPPDVVLMLRVLYALVPSVCNIVAFLVALAYPISREQHAAILAAIRNRQTG
jgi:GPH family glycoside/pentoside/hexuronide:cation symporter